MVRNLNKILFSFSVAYGQAKTHTHTHAQRKGIFKFLLTLRRTALRHCVNKILFTFSVAYGQTKTHTHTHREEKDILAAPNHAPHRFATASIPLK